MKPNAFLLIFFLFGSQISCDVYQPFFFDEEEVRHVRDVSFPKPKCEDEKLVGYLADCQITSPESIVGIAIADFAGTCRQVTETTDKINRYLKNCTSSPGLYVNLIAGLKSFDEKLCKNNDFYKRYDIYDVCIQDLDKDFDACDGLADWNEGDDREKVCKEYKNIVDCYYIKTAKVCGLNAAKTLKELMVGVIDCTLDVKCSVGSNPFVQNPMPETYIQSYNEASSTIARTKNGKIILKYLLIALSYVLIF